ncbi:MAG: STAS domain-containing protein [Verrucomicrobiota bacterium]
MALDIQFKRTPATVTAQLAGSLDTATAPELQRQLTPILDSQVTDLAFDLEKLTFISSAGLRVFSIARKRLKERGGQTSFVNMQPQIKEVFEIVKALPGVSIFASTAEMDAYLAAQQRKHTGGTPPDPNGPIFTIDA